MNKPLLDYTTEHMVKTTNAINNLLSLIPGTPEEKETAFVILTEYYEAVVEHLKAAESMNFACRTLYDMCKKEKEKNRQLPGFDSIRPTYTNKCGKTTYVTVD